LENAAYQEFFYSVVDPRATTYDILGVEHILSHGQLEETFTQGDRPLTLVSSSDSVWIYRRARVLPIARMVYQIEIVGDSHAAVGRIHSPEFDPTSTAIVSAQPPCQIGVVPKESGTARITKSEPGHWLIETESSVPALLVLSETAYPGWKASIDGQQVTWFTAYSLIRAVCVPAGKHQVEWVFDPVTYKVGAAITIVSLVACGFAGMKMLRDQKKKIIYP
jgi:hypothetical protein